MAGVFKLGGKTVATHDESTDVVSLASDVVLPVPEGYIIQTKSAIKPDAWATTSTSFVDIEGLSVTITPTSITSKMLIMVNLTYFNSWYIGHFGLFRNSEEIGMAVTAGNRPTNFMVYSHAENSHADGPFHRESNDFVDVPQTTSQIIYKIMGSARRDGQGGTSYINRTHTDRDTVGFDPRGISSIIVMEIAA
jgi:hypothetical protein